jgi:predicted amidohydrolase YtcJ
MTTEDTQRGLLITGARVFTADAARPWAEAVVTRGKRISFVGPEHEALARVGRETEHIHLQGGLLTPGLNESHMHFTMGSEVLHDLNLDGISTLPALQEQLRARARAYPEQAWITGYGLSYTPLTHLDRAERLALDEAVPDRPVFLRALDFHSAWCNTRALQLAGITEGAPLPLPNEVVLDANGAATGMLKERQAYHLIERLWPEPSRAERDARLAEAMRYLNGLGITSFQNMDGTPEQVAWFKQLHEEGRLTLRAHFYMSMREYFPRERLREFAELARTRQDEWNLVRGIKMFIDGVVESKTALMLDPYADGSGETGVPDMDPQAHREITIEADQLGMDVATHAIGERGVRLTLDAYEAAARANPERLHRRHRIEHIETIHPSDIPRFAQIGVTASMQPLHAVPNEDPRTSLWATLVGPARLPWAFPWRLLTHAGAVLSFGSDWPVVTPDPRLGIHSALTRRTAQGEPAGSWQPDQCLTLAETLQAYTLGGAYAESMEKHKGILREGALADLTCFDQDLFALSPQEILKTDVMLTVVDGKVVHRTQ